MLDTRKNRKRIYKNSIEFFGVTILVMLFNKAIEKKQVFTVEILQEIMKEKYISDIHWPSAVFIDSMKEVLQKSKKLNVSTDMYLKVIEAEAIKIEERINNLIQ